MVLIETEFLKQLFLSKENQFGSQIDCLYFLNKKFQIILRSLNKKSIFGIYRYGFRCSQKTIMLPSNSTILFLVVRDLSNK